MGCDGYHFGAGWGFLYREMTGNVEKMPTGGFDDKVLLSSLTSSGLTLSRRNKHAIEFTADF